MLVAFVRVLASHKRAQSLTRHIHAIRQRTWNLSDVIHEKNELKLFKIMPLGKFSCSRMLAGFKAIARNSCPLLKRYDWGNMETMYSELKL